MALKLSEDPRIAGAVSGTVMANPVLYYLEILTPIVAFSTAVIGLVIAVILVKTHLKKNRLLDLQIEHQQIENESDLSLLDQEKKQQ